jgi:hypothetical protein
MTSLTDLLQGIPLNAVLRERVALAEQRLKDLESENKNLKDQAATLAKENAALRGQLEAIARRDAAVKPTLQWGCYKFAGEDGLFCPACYDKDGKKYQTTRLDIGKRRCTVCRVLLG